MKDIKDGYGLGLFPVPFDENMGYGHTGSTEIDADFIVTKEENTLIAQIGEDVFSLEAIGKDKFKFDQIGAIFEFNPQKNTMTLFQGGGEMVFLKKK